MILEIQLILGRRHYECYAKYKNKYTSDVLEEWVKHNIMDKIYENYKFYNNKDINKVYKKIDSLLK